MRRKWAGEPQLLCNMQPAALDTSIFQNPRKCDGQRRPAMKCPSLQLMDQLGVRDLSTPGLGTNHPGKVGQAQHRRHQAWMPHAQQCLQADGLLFHQPWEVARRWPGHSSTGGFWPPGAEEAPSSCPERGRPPSPHFLGPGSRTELGGYSPLLRKLTPGGGAQAAANLAGQYNLQENSPTGGRPSWSLALA